MEGQRCGVSGDRESDNDILHGKSVVNTADEHLAALLGHAVSALSSSAPHVITRRWVVLFFLRDLKPLFKRTANYSNTPTRRDARPNEER